MCSSEKGPGVWPGLKFQIKNGNRSARKQAWNSRAKAAKFREVKNFEPSRTFAFFARPNPSFAFCAAAF
jgi:hypothetical protein